MSVTLPVVRAVLDANVLVPMSLCDLMLRLADEGLYMPLWSVAILDETERSLIGDVGLAAENARARCRAMSRHFPDAMVTGFAPLVPAMRNHLKDRHVLAAAVRAEAHVIVTRNLRDFPDLALAPRGIVALSPDAFLGVIFGRTPATVVRIVAEQAAALRHPAFSAQETLAHLERDVPTFVAALRARMQEH